MIGHLTHGTGTHKEQLGEKDCKLWQTRFVSLGRAARAEALSCFVKFIMVS